MSISYIQLPNIAVDPVSIIGNPDLLGQPLTALFCSIKCPGELILKTYDQALEFRKRGIAIISGFHSPMEKECLRIFLQRSQSIIMCPARGFEGMRIPRELRKHIDNQRLLIISSFKFCIRRATVKTSIMRNRFVGDLAETIFIAYAEPKGKMEYLCREWIHQGKTLFTFESKYTKNLLDLGAQIR